jgi:hypothetical protein
MKLHTLLCIFFVFTYIDMYICNMKNANIKIEQRSIAIGEDSRTNYLIIIETNNDIPVNTYIVCLHNFLFYNPEMKYYVVNQN